MYVDRLTYEQRRACLEFKTIVACDANNDELLQSVTVTELRRRCGAMIARLPSLCMSTL